MADKISSNNRHSLTKQHLDDFIVPGRLRYGTWVVPEIDMTEFDLYAVSSGDFMRIDRIAYKFYQDSTLWWVICVVNNIADPMANLVGRTLKIPKLANINRAFKL